MAVNMESLVARLEAVAARLEALLSLGEGGRAELGERLRGIVERDHEVDVLMRRLVREMGGEA